MNILQGTNEILVHPKFGNLSVWNDSAREKEQTAQTIAQYSHSIVYTTYMESTFYMYCNVHMLHIRALPPSLWSSPSSWYSHVC